MNLLRYQISGQLKSAHIVHYYRYYSSAGFIGKTTPVTCLCCGTPLSQKCRRWKSNSGHHIAPQIDRRPPSPSPYCNIHIPSIQPVFGILLASKCLARGNPILVTYRNFHVSPNYFEESKIGKTIKVLEKQEKENKSKTVSQIREVEKLIEKQDKLSQEKKPILVKIKDELKHYYHGIRLFVLDLRVAIRIAWNLATGRSLSRRERKQLVRTVSDIFRLVPFMVFLIIPFMEFLLPFYLKFFPFMLPSTFKQEQDEKRKTLQQLKGKLEMAKFLQDTLMESSVVGKLQDQAKAKEFSEFLQMVRETGKIPKEEDIMNYCSLFEDDITLDTLTYEQLKALCKMLEIPVIGPSAVLRLQLEMRVRALKG